MVEETKAAMGNGEEQRRYCPTRLLDDLPADHDAFGSHQRIAEAIAQLVKDEEGGKAIALIGSWGSGKSTVVKLLEKELEADEDTAIFAFDAWEHQGDPLRRSFLERLIDWLLDENWLTHCDKWRKEKEKVAKRLRHTRSFPRLTLAGTLMSFAALLLPTGLGLLSLGSMIIDLRFFKVQAWQLGILLSLIPFVLLLIMLLLSLCSGIRRFFVGEKIPYKDVLSLLLAGQITDNLVHETPDPTSVEFQTTFVEAIKESLARENHRLILVVDNLDRVSTEDALKIWATLRPFFKWEELPQQPEWTKRLWLLVPFAPETPQRLWKEDHRENEQEKAQEHSSEESKQVHQHKTLAEEFVEKTFHLRFDVPLPVMSDWREFFEEQFKKAFPRHSNDWHAPYRIFDVERVSNHRPPTPREIKLFINQLEAYHRIWQDEIPLPVQAWYVLAVHDLIAKHGPEYVLVQKYEGLLSEDAQRFFKSEKYEEYKARLQEYLAALYFQVDVNKAMQVLIGEEVREALRTGDKEKLKELQEKVRPLKALLAVVDRELSGGLAIWVEEDASIIAKAAWALSNLMQEDSSILGALWEQLMNSAEEVKWSALDELVVVDGLITLLQRSGNRSKALSNALLAHIKPLRAPLEEGEDQEPQADATTAIANWTKGLDRLLREIQQLGNKDSLQNFRIPGDAPFYVEVMREEVRLKNTLLDQFDPQAGADEVVEQLAALCSKAKFDKHYAEVVRKLSKRGWNWDELVIAISQRLSSLQEIGPEETIGCLRALLFLEKLETTPPVTQVFKEPAERGDLLHCMHFARGNDEAISLCVLLMLEYNPEGQLSSVPSGSQANNGLASYKSILNNQPDDSIQHLANLAQEFRKGDALLQSALRANEAKPLLLNLLHHLVENDYVDGYPSATLVVDQYHFLKETLKEPTLEKLLRWLVENDGLLDAIQQRQFAAELVDLYLSTLQISPTGTGKERFVEFLCTQLREIPQARWQSALLKEDPLLELVIALVEEGSPPALEHHFQDALVEHVQLLLSGQANLSMSKERWLKLIDAMAGSERGTFPDYLLKALLQNSDNSVSPVLAVYGNLLLEDNIVVNKADDVVGQLCKGILERKHPEELQWLAHALKKRPEILERCDENLRESFGKRIRSAMKEAKDEQSQEHLKAIASTANLQDVLDDVPEGGEDSNEG